MAVSGNQPAILPSLCHIYRQEVCNV